MKEKKKTGKAEEKGGRRKIRKGKKERDIKQNDLILNLIPEKTRKWKERKAKKM